MLLWWRQLNHHHHQQKKSNEPWCRFSHDQHCVPVVATFCGQDKFSKKRLILFDKRCCMYFIYTALSLIILYFVFIESLFHSNKGTVLMPDHIWWRSQPMTIWWKILCLFDDCLMPDHNYWQLDDSLMPVWFLMTILWLIDVWLLMTLCDQRVGSCDAWWQMMIIWCLFHQEVIIVMTQSLLFFLFRGFKMLPFWCLFFVLMANANHDD